ncbi:MAG TPA: hypothetical protein VF172_03045 [Nitrososphaera sp.]
MSEGQGKEETMSSRLQLQQQAAIARAGGDDGNGDDTIVCGHCGKRPAEIFQVTGDYCIECWQDITHTRV